MANSVVLIGAGGHAKVIANILKLQKRAILGFLDDNQKAVCCNLPRLGRTKDAEKFSSIAEFIICIGSNYVRRRIAETVGVNLVFTTAIHPDAVIAEDVTLAPGSVVMAGAVINPGTTIGRHCIVNTSSSIDHDCVLDDYVHISPGVVVSGTVHIGEGTWLGAGSVVINNLSICSDVIVGAGGVVINDILKQGTYVGVPACLARNELDNTSQGGDEA